MLLRLMLRHPPHPKVMRLLKETRLLMQVECAKNPKFSETRPEPEKFVFFWFQVQIPIKANPEPEFLNFCVGFGYLLTNIYIFWKLSVAGVEGEEKGFFPFLVWENQFQYEQNLTRPEPQFGFSGRVKVIVIKLIYIFEKFCCRS